MQTNTTILTSLSQQALTSLTTVVNETIATHTMVAKANFTAAQLWNIQSSKKAVKLKRVFA